MNCALVSVAIRRASVVLPVPVVPEDDRLQDVALDGFPQRTARAEQVPLSDELVSVRGRIRSASGASAAGSGWRAVPSSGNREEWARGPSPYEARAEVQCGLGHAERFGSLLRGPARQRRRAGRHRSGSPPPAS